MRRPDNGKHHALTQILLATLLMICVGETSADEWETLFDGQSLHQWDGDPSFWRVEDGAITGETTPEKALDQNSFLIWQGGYLDDFELRLRYKITSGNSGIQYRSFELADGRWRVGGYQADLEAGNQYSGILYGERFRGTLAERGTITTLSCVDGELKKSIEAVGDAGALQQLIHQDDWNEYHIVANGYRFQHYINGVLMSE